MGSFWNGFLLSISLCADLGVVNIATLRLALMRGGTQAFVLGIGSVVGDLTYFAAATTGATALLRWQPVRLALWICGTTTLLYLAFQAIREALHSNRPNLHLDTPALQGGHIRLFLSGVGLALSSPTAILWFAAIGGSVIASHGGDRRTLFPFTGGFALAGTLWAAAFAYGTASLAKNLDAKWIRWLSLGSAVLFSYLAVEVFVRGLRVITR